MIKYKIDKYINSNEYYVSRLVNRDSSEFWRPYSKQFSTIEEAKAFIKSLATPFVSIKFDENGIQVEDRAES